LIYGHFKILNLLDNLNYICIECPFHNILNLNNLNEKNYKEYKICFFSHNTTELLYHPFLYKTIFCPKINKTMNKCNEEFCHYAHDFGEDFRLLARVEKEEINRILIYCLNNQFFGFRFSHILTSNLNKIKSFVDTKSFNLTSAKEAIDNIINKENKEFKYEVLPSEFNPLTYKVFKCPFKKQCKLDPKLCLNYHDVYERRRNPRKFTCGKKTCANVYDKEKKKWRNPKNCPDVKNFINFLFHLFNI